MKIACLASDGTRKAGSLVLTRPRPGCVIADVRVYPPACGPAASDCCWLESVCGVDAASVPASLRSNRGIPFILQVVCLEVLPACSSLRERRPQPYGRLLLPAAVRPPALGSLSEWPCNCMSV